jgi:dTDP-4-dehydrorhamnose 3,5-epimerase
MLKVVLYDNREGSTTFGQVNEFFLGDHNPTLIVIPRMVYHGWKCISTREAIAINILTEPYNYTEPDEHRLDPHSNSIPYNWKRRDG